VFFPPIAVESPPTWKDFESIVHEKFLSSWGDRIFNTSFSTFQLTASRDGTLLVTADDRIIATKVFNTIFAVSALEGLTVFSVKESELGSVKVDAKTLEVVIYEGHRGVVFRNMILYDTFYRELGFSKGHRKIISKLQLMRILSRAEKVFENRDIRELLLSWLQAKTLFENSECGQAFIVSWINVEKDVFRILRDGERQQRLHGLASNHIAGTHLSFTYALKQLRHSRFLPSDRVDLLESLNVHRNQFIHQGEEISKEVAYTSLSLLKLIVDDAMDNF